MNASLNVFFFFIEWFDVYWLLYFDLRMEWEPGLRLSLSWIFGSWLRIKLYLPRLPVSGKKTCVWWWGLGCIENQKCCFFPLSQINLGSTHKNKKVLAKDFFSFEVDENNDQLRFVRHHGWRTQSRLDQF